MRPVATVAARSTRLTSAWTPPGSAAIAVAKAAASKANAPSLSIEIPTVAGDMPVDDCEPAVVSACWRSRTGCRR